MEYGVEEYKPGVWRVTVGFQGPAVRVDVNERSKGNFRVFPQFPTKEQAEEFIRAELQPK